jgi:hypothetical protein
VHQTEKMMAKNKPRSSINYRTNYTIIKTLQNMGIVEFRSFTYITQKKI